MKLNEPSLPRLDMAITKSSFLGDTDAKLYYSINLEYQPQPRISSTTAVVQSLNNQNLAFSSLRVYPKYEIW